MVHNQIKEDRMKSYFIESAKQIIKSDGLKALSVRTVAEKAGYSFATLYNYFDNLRDLIFYCVQDLLNEATQFIISEKHSVKHGFKKIESLSVAYCKYFIQYPDIFNLIYLEQMPDVSTEKTANSISVFFNSIFEEEWNYCFVNKLTNKSNIDDKKSIHKHLLNGMLLHYLNRGTKFNYNDFIKQVEKNVKIILN